MSSADRKDVVRMRLTSIVPYEIDSVWVLDFITVHKKVIARCVFTVFFPRLIQHACVTIIDRSCLAWHPFGFRIHDFDP